MNRRKDLSDLSRHKCMSPGCGQSATTVKSSTDRRGRLHTRTLCDACAALIGFRPFESEATRLQRRKAA